MNSKANVDFSNQGSLVAFMEHEETFIETFIDKLPFTVN